MFLLLLFVTFVVALAVSCVVDLAFRRPIGGILERIVRDEIHRAWTRYLRFAVYVVGVSSGVPVHKLEGYVNPRSVGGGREGVPLALTPERWVLEVYRTVIEALQGIAWMLLVFFLFALVAYVIVRFVETRRPSP